MIRGSRLLSALMRGGRLLSTLTRSVAVGGRSVAGDGRLSARMRYEMSRSLQNDDPWSLESSPYERHRYDVMLGMLADERIYGRALEVGCATGVFTAELSRRCATLDVIDVLPEAIDRCRMRLQGAENVSYAVADIGGDCGDRAETYDLIVVAEVLYYLEYQQHIAAAVKKVASWLRPGGILLFTSMVDAIAAPSYLIGAETTMREWGRFLEEIERFSCRGSGPGEHALIVKYRRPLSP